MTGRKNAEKAPAPFSPWFVIDITCLPVGGRQACLPPTGRQVMSITNHGEKGAGAFSAFFLPVIQFLSRSAVGTRASVRHGVAHGPLYRFLVHQPATHGRKRGCYFFASFCAIISEISSKYNCRPSPSWTESITIDRPPGPTRGCRSHRHSPSYSGGE